MHKAFVKALDASRDFRERLSEPEQNRVVNLAILFTLTEILAELQRPTQGAPDDRASPPQLPREMNGVHHNGANHPA
jgi:hypothetical protein